MLKRSFLILAALLLSTFLNANAGELPATVQNYLTEKDAEVTIRFDGLIIFTNGETYLPVLPQDPEVGDPVHVVYSVPEGIPYPDLIQFDNNFFLVRLVQTSSGRLTTPQNVDYPIAFREGLLPQDLVMPNNLYLPAELKIILGNLPYNPSLGNDVVIADPGTGVGDTIKTIPGQELPAAANTEQYNGLLYLFNMDDQILTVMDAKEGRKKGEVDLQCMPSTLKSSPDGKLLYAACLTTNELAVIDVSANLVKTRIPTGDKPGNILLIDEGKTVLVSSRFTKTVQAIDAENLLPGKEVPIPGNGGVMTALPGSGFVFVADAFADKVYLLDLRQQRVHKTYDTLPNISALWIFQDETRHPELWVASRSQNQVQTIDVPSGNILKTFDVGEKPVEMLVHGNNLFVLCASAARIDVIDWRTKALSKPITLAPGSLPSSVALTKTQNRAFIGSSGNPNLYLVDLEKSALVSTQPLPFRASPLALVGGPDPGLGTLATTAPAADGSVAPKMPLIPLELIINTGNNKAQAGDDTTPENTSRRGSLILQIPKALPSGQPVPNNLPPLFEPNLE